MGAVPMTTTNLFKSERLFLMSTEQRTNKRPTHRVYAVTKRNSGESNWDEVGAAWAHGDGNGFSLKLSYLPLNGGELVVRVPKEKSAAAETPAQPAEFAADIDGGF